MGVVLSIGQTHRIECAGGNRTTVVCILHNVVVSMGILRIVLLVCVIGEFRMDKEFRAKKYLANIP